MCPTSACSTAMLPRATIATPNLPEARILADLPSGSADDCAEKLLPFCEHLLITGGHGDEVEIHNRLYSRSGQQHTWTCQRLPGSYHGSGCTLASALAASTCHGACPWISATDTRPSHEATWPVCHH